MVSLEMKNYNMILIEKQQKYQHYFQAKLINMNILHILKNVLESFNFSNNINELKQVEDIFSGSQLNNLIKFRLKESIELQKSIKMI